MQKVRISRKGQVVIPAEIRRKLSLKHGEIVFVEEERGVIKIKPKTKLSSLRGTWPELDINTITKEIIEDREQDARIEKERERKTDRTARDTGDEIEKEGICRK